MFLLFCFGCDFKSDNEEDFVVVDYVNVSNITNTVYENSSGYNSFFYYVETFCVRCFNDLRYSL